jgi:hypothetical protein
MKQTADRMLRISIINESPVHLGRKILCFFFIIDVKQTRVLGSPSKIERNH